MRKVKCGMKNAESYCGMVGKTRNAEIKRLMYLCIVSPIVLHTNVDTRCDELGPFLIFYVLACGMNWPVDKQLSVDKQSTFQNRS